MTRQKLDRHALKALGTIQFAYKNHNEYILYRDRDTHPYIDKVCGYLDALTQAEVAYGSNVQMAITLFRIERESASINRDVIKKEVNNE